MINGEKLLMIKYLEEYSMINIIIITLIVILIIYMIISCITKPSKNKNKNTVVKNNEKRKDRDPLFEYTQKEIFDTNDLIWFNTYNKYNNGK